MFLESRYNKVSENEKQKSSKKVTWSILSSKLVERALSTKTYLCLENQKMNQRMGGYSLSMRPKDRTCKLFNDV